jgi:hypothetical protein
MTLQVGAKVVRGYDRKAEPANAEDEESPLLAMAIIRVEEKPKQEQVDERANGIPVEGVLLVERD